MLLMADFWLCLTYISSILPLVQQIRFALNTLTILIIKAPTENGRFSIFKLTYSTIIVYQLCQFIYKNTIKNKIDLGRKLIVNLICPW